MMEVSDLSCMHDLRVHVHGPMATLTECSESAVLASVISDIHVFTGEPVRHMGEYLHG